MQAPSEIVSAHHQADDREIIVRQGSRDQRARGDIGDALKALIREGGDARGAMKQMTAHQARARQKGMQDLAVGQSISSAESQRRDQFRN